MAKKDSSKKTATQSDAPEAAHSSAIQAFQLLEMVAPLSQSAGRLAALADKWPDMTVSAVVNLMRHAPKMEASPLNHHEVAVVIERLGTSDPEALSAIAAKALSQLMMSGMVGAEHYVEGAPQLGPILHRAGVERGDREANAQRELELSSLPDRDKLLSEVRGFIKDSGAKGITRRSVVTAVSKNYRDANSLTLKAMVHECFSRLKLVKTSVNRAGSFFALADAVGDTAAEQVEMGGE